MTKVPKKCQNYKWVKQYVSNQIFPDKSGDKLNVYSKLDLAHTLSKRARVRNTDVTESSLDQRRKLNQRMLYWKMYPVHRLEGCEHSEPELHQSRQL